MSSACPEEAPPPLSRTLQRIFDTHRRPDGKKHTQAELAEYVRERTNRKCDRGYISALVNGTITNPSLLVVKAIADFFGESVVEFLDDPGVARVLEILAQIFGKPVTEVVNDPTFPDLLQLAAKMQDNGVLALAARQMLTMEPEDVGMLTEVMSAIEKRRQAKGAGGAA